MGEARSRALGTAQVPPVGQGTWQLDRGDQAAAVAALRRGLELGLSHIDTAEMYGSGRAERLVGRAIAGRREQVFLASKVLPGNASLQGTVSACEASLRRLGTDHLDLYLLHWPGQHPLEHTFTAFERLREQGKILQWGVSNFDVDELEQALAVAGPGRLACDQVLYHLGQRYVELGVVPWCRRHGVAVVGYSPFGSGLFPAPDSPRGQLLQRVAEAHGATPRQVALAFLLRLDGLLTIPRTGCPEHAADNSGAAHLVLTSTQVRQLEAAFELIDPGHLPMI